MSDDQYQYTLDDCEFYYKGVVHDNVTTPEILSRCEQFEFRSDDIIVCTFPRTGTTLTQEIVWEIVNHEIIEKDAEFDSLINRFPFLAFDPKFRNMVGPPPVDLLKSHPKSSRRLIKTHLPYFMLRDQWEKVNPKIIIVMRNPKDTVVAKYHFMQALRGSQWTCTWDEYLLRFMNGKTIFGDFFDNCLTWWELRTRPNVLIVRYEDLVNSKHQQVRIISNFLGYRVPEKKIDVIVHNTDFKTMSGNTKVNIVIGDKNQTFLRKGKTGGWRDSFTVAQSEAMDKLIEKRLQGSSLEFIF